MVFTELSQQDRLRVLKQTKDVELLYDLFARHLNLRADEVRRKFRLMGDFIMSRVYIYGLPEDLFLISNYMRGLGMTLECSTNAEVRVDMDLLIDKMR